MHSVRSWHFEAVIGVGGIGAEPKSDGIARKVNWIGIGPRKKMSAASEWPLVTFDNYVFFGSQGPSFVEMAPRLANRMYENNVRKVMDKMDAVEKAEVEQILDLARRAPPSPADEARRPGGARPASHASCRARQGPARYVRIASLQASYQADQELLSWARPMPCASNHTRKRSGSRNRGGTALRWMKPSLQDSPPQASSRSFRTR
jgi:hypothetical protein